MENPSIAQQLGNSVEPKWQQIDSSPRVDAEMRLVCVSQVWQQRGESSIPSRGVEQGLPVQGIGPV